MKLRNGFVSNSSSSSFIIDRGVVSERQVDMILNHTKLVENAYDHWSIYVHDGLIEGSCSMDNFDMDEYLREEVKVDDDDVEWKY